jgi:excisionase family DNA binding protein
VTRRTSQKPKGRGLTPTGRTDLDTLPDPMTVDEVSGVLRCSRGTTYELISRKQHVAIRVGRLLRVTHSALLAFLAPR